VHSGGLSELTNVVRVLQTVVDLAFAASASGRKELLDCGGLDVIVRCLGFRKEKGLKSAGENSVHNKLQFEAFRASNSFLSGTFGEEEIEIDDGALYDACRQDTA
jgi:hypothetical protein